MWLTGATAVKHFSRFYVFLGCPLYHHRWHLWGAVIRLAAQFVPEGEVIRVSFDDTTKKKTGRHIDGLARYRNGAGSARQEYRTLRGVNCVLGMMHIPLTRWPGHCLSVPVGCELSLKAPQAQQLHVPYQSRSQLARAILDFAPRAAARDWSKLLESAVANAENNHELVGEDLYIKAVHADEGPTIKRFRPRAMGRATRIRKRTSHLTILLTPKE